MKIGKAKYLSNDIMVFVNFIKLRGVTFNDLEVADIFSDIETSSLGLIWEV